MGLGHLPRPSGRRRFAPHFWHPWWEGRGRKFLRPDPLGALPLTLAHRPGQAERGQEIRCAVSPVGPTDPAGPATISFISRRSDLQSTVPFRVRPNPPQPSPSPQRAEASPGVAVRYGPRRIAFQGRSPGRRSAPQCHTVVLDLTEEAGKPGTKNASMNTLNKVLRAHPILHP